MRPITLYAHILILGLLTPTDQIISQTTNFRLEHTRNDKGILNPKISPDGSNIIYLLDEADWEENKYIHDLWIVDTKTKLTRQLTFDRPNLRNLQWTPDGESISFIDKGKNDKPQVFLLSMKGGEARQITTSKTGVVAYSWCPVGGKMAYVANDTIAEKTGEDKFNKSYEVGYDSYLAESEPIFSHIWICDSDGNNPRQMTDNDSGINAWSFEMEWSGDGKYIAFSSVPSAYRSKLLDGKILLMDVESGDKNVLIPSGANADGIEFSDDGESILYTAPRGDEIAFSSNGLFKTSKVGEDFGSVLDIDRNVEAARWLDENHFIAMLTDGTTRSLWVGDFEGNTRQISTGDIVPSALHVGKKGDLALVGSSPHGSMELYYMSSVDGEMVSLTDINTWTDSLAMGDVTTIEWETHDGFTADGVLTYPVNYEEGKRYPLALVIHGGPMGSSKEQFSPLALAMASEGWLVFQPNYRGSNNRGNAYQRAVINDAGEGPGKDVMAGIQKLVSMGLVDTARMAVSGWSYGGYMTVWLTSHYDVWRAGVAGAAVTDWFDWYSMADLNIWSGLGLGGSPWTNENAENYREQSPITYAHQIKAPTLILSNTYDERVTVSQSYKLFHNLKDNGVETQFIAYPLKGHFPGDPINQMDVMERWIAWIRERI